MANTIRQAIRFVNDTKTDTEFGPRVKKLLPGVTSIKNLYLPTESKEEVRCQDIAAMLRNYEKQRRPERPLSIAGFGPPGSGKSRTVKELLAAVGGYQKPMTVNLSQLSSPADLARTIKNHLSQVDSKGTPVVFFDEFDADLGIT